MPWAILGIPFNCLCGGPINLKFGAKRGQSDGVQVAFDQQYDFDTVVHAQLPLSLLGKAEMLTNVIKRAHKNALGMQATVSCPLLSPIPSVFCVVSNQRVTRMFFPLLPPFYTTWFSPGLPYYCTSICRSSALCHRQPWVVLRRGGGGGPRARPPHMARTALTLCPMYVLLGEFSATVVSQCFQPGYDWLCFCKSQGYSCVY